MRTMKWTVLAWAFIGTLGRADADFLPDRATLNAILGSSATTEDFERYRFTGDLGNAFIGTLSLDSKTIAFDGQGPGLVSDGVRFTSPDLASLIWWTRDGFEGLDTQGHLRRATYRHRRDRHDRD